MSAESLVFWAFAVAWVVVAVLLLFVQLPRVVREALRIVKRALALSRNSELERQFAKAEADGARIEATLKRIPVLQRRAVAAMTIIRTTPLVPPALAGLRIRIRREIQAFWQELR